MLKQLKKRTEGFTIIEVLIVLAIAGLIMLIVFLAVPALQRNQRNTSRKNDVARVGGAATEYVSNNNGTIPTAGSRGTIQNSAGKLGQYSGNYLTIAAGAVGTTVTSTTAMTLMTNATCGANGASAAGTSTRQMIILYALESGGGSGYTSVCTPV